MNLGDFIDTYKEAISQRVVESYPPLYRPSPSKPTGARRSSARWAPARPSVRRVTRHRIPGSAGKNSEKVLGPTDPP